MLLLLHLLLSLLIFNRIIIHGGAQSSSVSTVPIYGSGSLSYNTAPSLFPNTGFLNATATLSSTSTSTTPTTTLPPTTTAPTTNLTTTFETVPTLLPSTTPVDTNTSNVTNVSTTSIIFTDLPNGTNVMLMPERRYFIAMEEEDGTTHSTNVTSPSSFVNVSNHTNINSTTIPTLTTNATSTAAPPPTLSQSVPLTSSTTWGTTTTMIPNDATRYVDYCTTNESKIQLQQMCDRLFAISAVSGFGTSQVKYAWGVGSDGLSRGASIINSQMMTTPGDLLAKGCQTVLEDSTDGRSRYVAQIRFNCSCNEALLTEHDTATAVAIVINTRTAAISNRPDSMVATWTTGFQSSPRGGTCEPRTGRCPSMVAMDTLFKRQLTSSTNRFTEFGCPFLLQFPYLVPLQNYFQDCTPRALRCSSNHTIEGNWNKTYFNFTCPLCRGGVQTFAMTMTSQITGDPSGGYFSNCESKYYASTGRVCDTFAECSGNGCCRTDENVATNLFSSVSSQCACFDNEQDGHYLNAACDRCQSRYTICSDSTVCGGGAAGVQYFMCVVDQQQLFALLAELSTTPMAMTMPLLIMLGIFIIIGLIRSSWESDQEFEMTGIRRAGCNSISGKLASLHWKDETTRQRLHMAIDEKIIPSRHPKSKGMIQQQMRQRMAVPKQ